MATATRDLAGWRRPAVPGACIAAALIACGVPAETCFEERAEAAGLSYRHDNGMSGQLYLVENLGPGVGLLDYDGDGDLDVVLPQGHRLAPGIAAGSPGRGARLFRNDLGGDGRGALRPRFVDVTGRARLEALGYGIGVATGDIDGDGDVDLYLTNYGPNQLWRNEGDGTFRDGTAAAGVGDPQLAASAAFADLDGDGRPDLYLANYLDYRLANARPCLSASGAPDYCGPQSFEPVPDRLFRNLGGGRFEDVTVTSGIRAAVGKGLGVGVLDADGDGRLDVYVANDLVPNFLWRNRGDGSFEEVAALHGVAVDQAGAAQASMGVVIADLDGDLDEDIVVTNLDGEGSTFYRNLGGRFEDASQVSGLRLPSFDRTGFGAVPLDYDNDGSLDLLTANGAIRLIEAQRRAGVAHPLRQENQLFHGLGAGRFAEVEPAAAGLGPPEVGRGAAAGDLDNDGDGDVVVTNNGGPARLLVNVDGQGRAWLGLAPAPTLAASGWDGRLAIVTSGPGERRLRRFKTDCSYASACDGRALVGLGAQGRGAAAVDLRGELRLEDLPAGRYYVLPPRAAGLGAP